MRFLRLKKRSQFLQVSSQGRRIHTPLFILVYLNTLDFSPHFGLVVTKKIGNAVVRNRIKRRLRAVLDKVTPKISPSLKGYYVIISKPSLFTESFLNIEATMQYALKKTL